MKKIYSCLLLIFFILFSNLSYSQVSFGVKSGINIATTKGLLAFPKNRVGWYGGGFAKIPLRNKFFLQPELLYSSKGQRTEDMGGPTTNSITRLNYINIPILIGYKIDAKTSLLLGPELGYLTMAQLQFSTSGFFDESKSYPSKFDVGLDICINYKVIKDIGIEARYNYGLNTLYSVDAVGNRYTKKKGSNRVFQIGINYLLN